MISLIACGLNMKKTEYCAKGSLIPKSSLHYN